MKVTRWDPFRDLFALQQQVNRLYAEQEREPGAATSLSRFSPPIDVYEDQEGVSLFAELPGVEPSAVEVKFEDGMLTISGERKLDREETRDNYHRLERAYGTFERTFSLSPSYDVEKIRAEHKHGVLRIFVPKREDTKPKRIAINVAA